ncbi:MAG: hypothetical protein H6867_04460 [Rhodospirillales bacterium]|nr:hypothetical protein [Rhodospirillales bacterium]MCB9996403.1 hypothetical protein [Rhodospirillales bacterium]
MKKLARHNSYMRAVSMLLVAGVSFSLLSYMVAQSTRSGGGDAGRETSKISSAQLTQYPAGIRTSIVRMIISGQEAETLEFNAPSVFDGCTEDPENSDEYRRCVFHPTGGGATFVEPAVDLVTAQASWVFNGENEIEYVGTTTTGEKVSKDTADLIAFLPGVTKVVCKSINDELGIPGIPQQGGVVLSSMVNPDGKTPTSLGASGTSLGYEDGSALAGQPFGCFQRAEDQIYVYYHVLIER